MSSKRAYIPWKEKCAALICLHFGVPYDHQLMMDVEHVNSLVHFDHYPVAKAFGGPDKFFNLTPRLIADHRAKTARIDAPAIAKVRRAEKRRVQAANTSPGRVQKTAKRKRMGARPFPKMPEGFKRNWKSGRIERAQP